MISLQYIDHRINRRKIKKTGAQFYKDLKTWSENYIRAPKASGAINNGNIDFAEFVTLFKTIFQLDLKEPYHKFTDITNRKKEIPVFLNKLTNAILRWITDKMGF